MDIERAKRYREKLNFIMERVADIEDWMPSEVSDFSSDKRNRLAKTQKWFPKTTTPILKPSKI